MQETPKGNRPHIGVFGRRNAGKSSLINSLTNQELALVSEVPGTTTDPVYKAMELQPLGPVMMIDTAGIDDSGELGKLRVKKTMEVIRKIDLAVMVIDPEHGIEDYEKDLLAKFSDANTPVVAVVNKTDLNFNQAEIFSSVETETEIKPVFVSTVAKEGIEALREEIVNKMPADTEESFIVGDLVNPGDTIVLVTPIDLAAPKGRLILPQVQTIRDILDHDGITMVCKERELKLTLDKLKEPPKLVVTDSQAFMKVDADVPDDILLTGFSILFARYKGDLEIFLRGAKKMENLQPGDKVLIAEACTHRRQADDIGTVKLPRWLRSRVGGELEFDHVSGREYPDNLTDYDLILHCGSCMLNKKEVLSRLKEADELGVPVINYGMAIAQLHGILDRALKPFTSAYRMWLAEKEEF
ncbi:[FeFe] hydrogenase H-cluster maturation GTPase HydF [Halanaerobium kushneri]|uniref:Iron-only hydrogenase maturation protein HydF n=1 Tax=Halanaerobium kushneri TaxID=56779 RepID=A0A1N6YV82_9FIRM|nr:[FeFe] hydrogenase H-cluster maturation GTPase HydF [Halanaerobium kushneri]SIR18339.1 iron-only hydrogenase maturation protein HydF [Halanaerobium kushneri]